MEGGGLDGNGLGTRAGQGGETAILRRTSPQQRQHRPAASQPGSLQSQNLVATLADQQTKYLNAVAKVKGIGSQVVDGQ